MTRRGLMMLTAGMGLLTCGMVGLLVCRAEEEAPPPVPELVLPAAPVGYEVEGAVWTVALFVDLEAPESRQAFSEASRAVSQGRLRGRAELRLLHAPAGGCPPGERERLRCAAARAVECAEGLVPGSGVPLAGAVFDLQWEAPEQRGLDAVVRAAGRLAVDAAKLRSCVGEDPEVEARVREHAAFAAGVGLARAPGGYVLRRGAPSRVAPFFAADTAETLGLLSVCLAHGRCREAV